MHARMHDIVGACVHAYMPHACWQQAAHAFAAALHAQIFVSEQLLYSKDTLKRHQEAGDASGPLAESGFKGHPLCKFCRWEGGAA